MGLLVNGYYLISEFFPLDPCASLVMEPSNYLNSVQIARALQFARWVLASESQHNGRGIGLRLVNLAKLTSRVDLHRSKMLIIQFHTLCLWKIASHTNFKHFCKMSLIEFQRYFIVVLVSKLVSLHKKREKNGMKKNANHTISIYGNCIIRIFFKIFFCEKKALINQFNCWQNI